jgi:hypothetical protein
MHNIGASATAQPYSEHRFRARRDAERSSRSDNCMGVSIDGTDAA